ncbi:MAG: AraC family transcriptional regulator [Balneolaceae bacterium]
MKIYVKNMVSKRCLLYVKGILKRLDIKPVKVSLGVIVTKEDLSREMLSDLNSKLKKVDLELCEKKVDQVVESIKHVIIDFVYNIENQPNFNISDLLSKKLGYNYNYLSNIFLKQNSITIQEYVIRIKIERVKELLMMDEHTLTQISYILQYSSCAHLSNQFKKVTGLPPSHFKEKKSNRKTIQEV